MTVISQQTALKPEMYRVTQDWPTIRDSSDTQNGPSAPW